MPCLRRAMASDRPVRPPPMMVIVSGKPRNLTRFGKVQTGMRGNCLLLYIAATVSRGVEFDEAEVCQGIKMFVASIDPVAVFFRKAGDDSIRPWNVESFFPGLHNGQYELCKEYSGKKIDLKNSPPV